MSGREWYARRARDWANIKWPADAEARRRDQRELARFLEKLATFLDAEEAAIQTLVGGTNLGFPLYGDE